MVWLVRACGVWATVALLTMGARAATLAPAGGAALCERAAMQAAAETGVPADIMGALTLSETGRRHGGAVRPWAWSVNAEGAGSWFDVPQQALAFAHDRIAQGRSNVDIGCFQLNFRWHGQHFPSLNAMFDPLTNARYAARFVRDLYGETGDWRRAAGMFHSRSPAEAARYLNRFDELRQAFQQKGFSGLGDAPQTYNRFASAAAEPYAAQAPMQPEVDPSGAPVLSPELATALGLTDEAAPREQRRVRAPRPRVTLLGAPLGSAGTGRAGSLAVIASAPGPIVQTASRPLIGGEPQGTTVAQPGDDTASPAATDEALRASMAALDPERDWPAGTDPGPDAAMLVEADPATAPIHVMPGETAPYAPPPGGKADRTAGGPAFVTDPSGRYLILADTNSPDPFAALPPELQRAPADGGL